MKYKRDYQITVQADMNDNVSWSATHKGKLLSYSPSTEDYEVIAAMLDSARQHITNAIAPKEDKGLEYWLWYYGMPPENIEKCANQLAQGYGACRYLEGLKDGADAVE